MNKQSGNECVRVHRYTMSRQSGVRPRLDGCDGEAQRGVVRVHWYTMSKQSGHGRFAGTLVHMGKQSGGKPHRDECDGEAQRRVSADPRVNRYTMSRQSGPGCTGTL